MKKSTRKFFNLKLKKHPVFGFGYEYKFSKNDWCKDSTALYYTLESIEKWAKNMKEILLKEEKL